MNDLLIAALSFLFTTLLQKAVFGYIFKRRARIEAKRIDDRKRIAVARVFKEMRNARGPVVIVDTTIEDL